MAKNVKLPDGSIVAFPDDMDDDAIGAAIKANQPAPPSEHPYIDAAKDFGKGILKSGIGIMSAADDFAQKHLPAFMTTPIGQAPTPENSARAVAAAKEMATPNGTTQSLGKVIGNAAQFLIPGAAEEAGASMLAPTVGRLASKVSTGALGSGIVNKAQGGSFGGGAAMGAAGAGLGLMLKSAAPTVAESALGVRAADRSAGRTPGQGILEETTGVKPGDIANQAYSKVSKYTGDLENNATNSTISTDLQPGRDVASSFLQTAVKRNNPATIKEVGQLGKVLDERATTGPIPRFVPADEALALRRGIDDLHGSWSPNATRDFSDRAVGATRSAMNSELETSIPDFRNLNSKISTLLPVANRAGAADLNAGVLQRVLGKAARPTGALVGSIAGGTAGYKEDGIRGATIGGIGGLVAPEILTSPTTLMRGARLLDSSILQRGMPAMTGLGLQMDPTKR